MFKRKKRLKPKRTPPRINKIVMMTLIVFIAVVYLSIELIDKGIEPTLMQIANKKTQEFSTRAINTAVEFTEDYEFEDISHATYDNEGEVATFGWDSATISEINRVATDRVEEYLEHMNRGKPSEFDESVVDPPESSDGAEDLADTNTTVVEIPIGQATGNTLLANLGPKIPVNLQFVGSVNTDVVRESESFGMNATFYRIYLKIEADVQVVVPFSTEVATVDTKVDIDSGIVMGPIPEFYGSGSDNPSISVPKDSITGNEQ